MRSPFWSVLAAILASCPAFAQLPDEGESGSWTIVFENDEFADADRHYTSGARFSWTSAAGDVEDWLRPLADGLLGSGTRERQHVSLTLGQSIFTPNDLRRDPPDRDDRPYAGWLYGGVELMADHGDMLERWGLALGVVGPAALGRETQTLAHRITGTTKPAGWDDQLANEPGLVVSYDRIWRVGLGMRDGAIGVDLLPHLGASAGNVFTHAAAGLTVRIGRQPTGDYGPVRVRPGMPGGGMPGTSRDFGWYLFGGIEGRAVLRNIFLDGNTFEGGPSVDRKPLVGDMQLGAALLYRGARLAYTHVFRTREFDGQHEPDVFGALSVAVRF